MDSETGQEVAVKIFYRSRLERKMKDGIGRLHAEYDLVRHLDHTNVVKYYDLFESGQKIYLIMELGGVSLDSVVASTIEPVMIQSIIRQLLEVTLYLSSEMVAHHDIKPANILFDPETDRLLLCDFGVAEQYGPDGCKSFFGTPTFQAPEIAGNVTGVTYDGPKAEVWSIGVLLYYLVTGGEYPFKAETVYLLLKAIEEQPVILPDNLDPLLFDLMKGNMYLTHQIHIIDRSIGKGS